MGSTHSVRHRLRQRLKCATQTVHRHGISLKQTMACFFFAPHACAVVRRAISAQGSYAHATSGVRLRDWLKEAQRCF